MPVASMRICSTQTLPQAAQPPARHPPAHGVFFMSGDKNKKSSVPRGLSQGTELIQVGGDLLSRFRSTIGAGGLNFSVRNGKRWGPAAIAAFSFLASHPARPRPRGGVWMTKARQAARRNAPQLLPAKRPDTRTCSCDNSRAISSARL